MASYHQPNVRSVQQLQLQKQQHYYLTTPTTITNYNRQNREKLPERFALTHLQPTNQSSNKNNNNNNNNSDIYNYHIYYYSNYKNSIENSNKLIKYICSYHKSLHLLLHATVLTIFALLLSNWIAQASVAAAVATPALYELQTSKNIPPTHKSSFTDAVVNIDVVNEDDFNSSAFISFAIPNTKAIQTTAIAPSAAYFNGTTMHNIHNKTNNSISPHYVAKIVEVLVDGGGRGSGGSSNSGSNAALITTSSIWDPILGAPYPTTDISIATAPTSMQGTNEDETDDFDELALPPWHAAIVCIILMIIIIGTVIGNVLVCIAVCMVRKLRRPCNYLLVSLALSDLCVALLVMPMAMLYEVLDKWNFGPILCDIWVSFDVLCCTASILNLCAISVDRYLAITKPLEYGVKRTPRRMMACVALVWLAAASISLPPLLILGNEHMDEHGTPICIVCQNFAYQIYATLGSFYIPLSVMLFVYYQIFRAARRIVLEEKRAQTHLQHALNGTGSPPAPAQPPQPPPPTSLTAPPSANTDVTVLGSGNGQRHSSYGNTSLTYSTCGTLSAHHPSGGSGGGVSGSTGLLGSPHQKKLRFQLAKEKKASTTLGIIMSAFTICWLPFFILALIRPFVESDTVHVPHSLSSLFLWLGYANSLLNPIIYATLNRDFRKPFQLILHLRCSSLNTMMRENYYQDQYGEPPSQRVMLGDERHGARESFL